MSHGGPRNRAGAKPSPTSVNSYGKWRTLPIEGRKGRAPKFPLESPTDQELKRWRDAWKSPQAVAWIEEPWRWQTIALWVRWSVRMEDPSASAGLGTVVVRLADQVGMTPAGLKENLWIIGDPPKDEDEEEQPKRSARDRMRVVDDE